MNGGSRALLTVQVPVRADTVENNLVFVVRPDRRRGREVSEDGADKPIRHVKVVVTFHRHPFHLRGSHQIFKLGVLLRNLSQPL